MILGYILFIFILIFCSLITWAIIGGIGVFYLDMFGKRYDYEKDYPLTRSEIFLAGPLVWWMKLTRKK